MNFVNKINSSLTFLSRNNIICLTIVSLIFFLDRTTKIKIINQQIQSSSLYINEYLNFDLVWNTGIGFGLMSYQSTIAYNLITFTISGIIIFLIYLITKSTLVDKVLFSLILGGALGNLYDRAVYFAVPDFIDVHYKSFHWFTFNIADIFITFGILTILCKDIFLKNEKNS
tara:strand:+ start:558 stop:1070 length:513 start_codon:yes stop_codon:yes gene_type:complete